jgi:uncharacterized protein YidB (DUF937 family)
MKAKQICTGLLALAASLGAAAQDAADDYNGPTFSCVGAMAGESRLAALDGKVGMAPMPYASTGRALNRIADAGERQAIALWMQRRDECFVAGTQYRLYTMQPDELSYTSGLFAVQQHLVIELLQGRLTFAEYNHTRFDMFESAQAEAGYQVAASAW